MSQNDFNIANQGFPSFRSDLNSALQALASNSAGTSAPATTYAYMWWYDSTNNVLKMRNADNDAWINFASFNQATDTWSVAALTVDGAATVAGDLTVDTNTLYVDSTNNRVGVGTVTPIVKLHAAGTTGTVAAVSGTTHGIRFESDADYGLVGAAISAVDDTLFGSYQPLVINGSQLAFASSGTERMRLDASGNLLVGQTSLNYNVVGASMAANGVIRGCADASAVAAFNRKSSDGAIANFYKDGTAVGSIGVSSGRNYIASDNGSTGCGVIFGTNGMFPTNRLGQSTDNTYDVGAITARWDDIYATNAIIQTSDRNEKQQIAELTATEMEAAKAISKLFKTFKWNDSVAEKGDDARIHSGVIAQEVEAAMADAGLDAGKYAFFISSTWWESTEVIPAVEEVLDEEGNVVTEAQAERTVTHQHDTAEEAPEGAVERNRKGIRYPQLLAFVGAATEQRLASIEARLDAAGL